MAGIQKLSVQAEARFVYAYTTEKVLSHNFLAKGSTPLDAIGVHGSHAIAVFTMLSCVVLFFCLLSIAVDPVKRAILIMEVLEDFVEDFL